MKTKSKTKHFQTNINVVHTLEPDVLNVEKQTNKFEFNRIYIEKKPGNKKILKNQSWLMNFITLAVVE